MTDEGSRKVYEYRVYRAKPGRLPDLHNRFEKVTLPYFEKHGIHAVGIWDSLIGDSDEVRYIIEWESLTDRETRWSALLSDEEWLRARAETETRGPLAARRRNELWQLARYSPRPTEGR